MATKTAPRSQSLAFDFTMSSRTGHSRAGSSANTKGAVQSALARRLEPGHVPHRLIISTVEFPQPQATSSLLFSGLIAVALLSGAFPYCHCFAELGLDAAIQVFSAELAASEVMTIVGGFLCALFFFFLLIVRGFYSGIGSPSVTGCVECGGTAFI